MKPEFECRVTAAFLDSGKVLCGASHCAALMAAGGLLLSHLLRERVLFAASMACWPVACFLALRVAIDAALFRELAGEASSGWRSFDELLRKWGLLRGSAERTVAERSRGAMKLWKRLIVIVVLQVAILGAGLAV
jgi:hypothetical protein